MEATALAGQQKTCMEKKIFWGLFVVLGLVADLSLPVVWALLATIPIAVVSWWVAYRSHWFD
jgi:hypothetical protein